LAELNPVEVRKKCKKFLSGHHPKTQRQWLEDLAASPLAEEGRDAYSNGPNIEKLEKEVAELLGKEAGLWVPKGITAQQMALLVYADRARCRNVALHPKSHIELDESDAYEKLSGLKGILVGKDHLPFTVADLDKVTEPLAAVAVELPLRRPGYKLPSWEDLTGISEWCKGHGVPLHFDGARLWEAAPYYDRSLAEIAGLADSVYVSFYKGLGGLTGCILAGPADFINETKVWRNRFGGNLFTAFPYIISAIEGMHHHLPKMAGYYQQAVQIAAELAEIPGLIINPNPPNCNSFQVLLPAEIKTLQQANLEYADREEKWLFGYFDETGIPGLSMGEVVVGEAAADWTTTEIVDAFKALLALSKES